MRYHHVDVFGSRPYTGNSLAVFPRAAGLTGVQMARITQELRHFESIFLVHEDAVWAARIFDLFDELDFAGHPVVGAACVLHAEHGLHDSETWTFRLRSRTVRVTTRREDGGRYASVLDQGRATFLGRPDPTEITALLGLDPDDLDPELTPEVVTTGLRYLVVPVRGTALDRARIVRDLDAPLAQAGAQYAYLLDATRMEGRHWNNDGVVEDVATGSAAGCVAAYLRRHGRIGDGEAATLHQGRLTGRPSEMTITAYGEGEDIRSVEVGGAVFLVGEGHLRELPG